MSPPLLLLFIFLPPSLTLESYELEENAALLFPKSTWVERIPAITPTISLDLLKQHDVSSLRVLCVFIQRRVCVCKRVMSGVL